MKHSNISTLQKKPPTMKPPKEKRVLNMLCSEVYFEDHPKHFGFFQSMVELFLFFLQKGKTFATQMSFSSICTLKNFTPFSDAHSV
jgi:hypothetical protein